MTDGGTTTDNSVQRQESSAVTIDWPVSSLPELHTALSNLSPGDTVFVRSKQTPYRTRQWLDIDTDNVTVVFQSQFAGNGDATIKVADGANVGGFRIGKHSPVEHVEIVGAGFDGNHPNQNPAAKRLHAYYVYDADHTRFSECYATRTSPYHEHTTGGSGFSTTRDSRWTTIENCLVDDIGDRCIQVSGRGLVIKGNRLYNGFDRGIATSMSEDDGSSSAAKEVLIANNVVKGMSNGSAIGVGGYPVLESNPVGQITVVGNEVFSDHRSGVKIYGGNHDISVSGNTLHAGSADGVRLINRSISDSSPKIMVGNNTIRSPHGRGIHVADEYEMVTIVGNGVQAPVADGIRITGNNCIVGLNTVRDAGGYGIETTSSGNIVLGNRIIDSKKDPIRDAGEGNEFSANLTGSWS